MEKSIQERAAELGVPVIQPIERLPNFPPSRQDHSDFYKQVQAVEAICGGCGKELMKGQMRQPCGHQNCPFGVLTNYTRTL
jgi:hypothetical protein